MNQGQDSPGKSRSEPNETLHGVNLLLNASAQIEREEVNAPPFASNGSIKNAKDKGISSPSPANNLHQKEGSNEQGIVTDQKQGKDSSPPLHPCSIRNLIHGRLEDAKVIDDLARNTLENEAEFPAPAISNVRGSIKGLGRDPQTSPQPMEEEVSVLGGDPQSSPQPMEEEGSVLEGKNFEDSKREAETANSSGNNLPEFINLSPLNKSGNGMFTTLPGTTKDSSEEGIFKVKRVTLRLNDQADSKETETAPEKEERDEIPAELQKRLDDMKKTISEISVEKKTKLVQSLQKTFTAEDVTPLTALKFQEVLDVLGLKKTTWRTFTQGLGIFKWGTSYRKTKGRKSTDGKLVGIEKRRSVGKGGTPTKTWQPWM